MLKKGRGSFYFRIKKFQQITRKFEDDTQRLRAQIT